MNPHLSFAPHQRTAIRLILLAFILAGLTGLSGTPSLMGGVPPRTQGKKQAAAVAPANIVPGVVVVKLRPTGLRGGPSSAQGPSMMLQALSPYGVTSLVRTFPAILPLSKSDAAAGKVDLSMMHYAIIPTYLKPVEVAAQLAQLPEVEYAEPKFSYRLAEIPDDSDYVSLQRSYFDQMQVAAGWALQKGRAEVTIATVDGGTNWHLPDLAANLWINPAEDANHNGRFDAGDDDGIDQDGDGYTDDVIGWNFAKNTNDPRGDSTQLVNKNHGTHTASAFGAVTNNGLGMAGTSYNCRLMAVCGASPQEDNSVIFGFEGIVFAAAHGARVINCSWERPGGWANGQQSEQDMITWAWEHHALVVAAAGNNHLQNLDETPFYPASYEHVLSVGATRSGSDEIAPFTDIGLNVGTFAPGEGIRVANDDGSYGFDKGTSLSSPLVAGLAGLLFCAHPDWGPEQVAEQIRITSDPIDPVNPDHAGSLGHGRVNFFRALSEVHAGIVVEADAFRNPSGARVFLEGDTVILGIRVKNVLTIAAEQLTFSVSVDSALIPLSPVLDPGRLDAGSEDSLTFLFRVAHIAQEQDAKIRLRWSANGNEEDAHMFENTVFAGDGYWERQWSPTMTPLTSVHAVNSRVAWAAGFSYGTDGSGEVLRTTDGGHNWIIVKSNFGQWSRWVFALDSLTAWLNVNLDTPANRCLLNICKCNIVLRSGKRVGGHRSGSHEITFNPGNLASGVYFYRLQADESVQTRKLLLLR